MLSFQMPGSSSFLHLLLPLPLVLLEAAGVVMAVVEEEGLEGEEVAVEVAVEVAAALLPAKTRLEV
jgi:hypothetical protein